MLLATALVAALVRWDLRLVGAALLGGGGAVLVFALLRPLLDEGADRVTTLDESYVLIQPDRMHTAAGLAAITASSPSPPRGSRAAGGRPPGPSSSSRPPSTSSATPSASTRCSALLAGWVAGAATVVALGAPSRRPAGAAIAAGLDAVGVPLARLEQASLDARGSTPYFGTRPDGVGPLRQGPGRRTSAAPTSSSALYRRIQPRDLGDEKAFSTLRRAVEHEALVALFAGSVGVRTPSPRGRCHGRADGYVLAYEAVAGRSLDRVEPGEVTDVVLAEVWRPAGRAALATGSRTATCGSPTCSWPTTATCG